MVNEDLPFIVIGVILGSLGIATGIILVCHWTKQQRKMNHLSKRYKTEANVYSTNKQGAGTAAERIYYGVDSFRRQLSSSGSNERTVTSSTEDVFSVSRNVEVDVTVSSPSQNDEEVFHSSRIVLSQFEPPSVMQNSSTAASPPPLPARNYSTSDIRITSTDNDPRFHSSQLQSDERGRRLTHSLPSILDVLTEIRSQNSIRV